jgi:hypothetical protein
MSGESSYLPEMEAPPPPSEGEQEQNITMEINEDDEGNIVYSDNEDEVPEVVMKPKIAQEDIFADAPKIVKIKAPPKEKEESPKTRELPKEKLTKAGKPKRKPTQKQLEHLATIRAKGQETRRRKAEAKKLALARGEEVPKTEKRKKEIQETKEVVKQEFTKYSKEEIEEITFKAIERHEEKRKLRKAEKKKLEEEKLKTHAVNTTLRRATGNPAVNDVWGQALAGMF